MTVAPTTASVPAGQTITLAATVAQTNCTNPTVSWQSDNLALATVSQSGVVTGVAEGGPVTITATLDGTSGQATVTVLPPRVAAVELTPGGGVLQPAGTLQLGVITKTAAGDAVTGREITFASSNDAVASVSETGLITAGAPGLAAITVTSEDGSAVVNIITEGPSANRFAYAWASNSSTESYTPPETWQYATSGQPVTINRPSSGTYDVTFPGLAKGDWNREIVLVSAYGALNRTCQSGPWGSNGTDLVARVYCFLPDGQPGDSPFTVLVAEAGTIDGRLGFLLVDQPAKAGEWSPDPRFSENSANGVITVIRNDLGNYSVRFVGLGRTGADNPETVIASAYGDVARRCNVGVWSENSGGDFMVNIRCFDMTGAAADSRFVAMVLDNGRAGNRVGLSWVNDAATASYTINNGYWHTSTGDPIAITHSATGVYSVRLGGQKRLGVIPETVLVTSYSGTEYCNVYGWNPNGTDLMVDVRCYDAAGNPADTQFDVLLIE